MQLDQIISLLSAYELVPVQLPCPSVNLLGIRVAPGRQGGTNPNLINLYTAEEFSCLSLEEDYTGSILVCDGDCSALSRSTGIPKTANVITLGRPAAKDEIADALSELFAREQLLSSGMQAMLRAQAEGKGIQRLVDVAYTILKNPIFVSDLSNKYVAAVYDENTFDPEGTFAGFILDDILYNFISSTGHGFISRNKLDEALKNRTRPLRIFHEIFQTECLFSNIRIESVVAGRIFMCAMEHPFTDADVELFSFLVNICDRELKREGGVFFNLYAQDSMCLVDLISNSYMDEVMSSRCTMVFHLKPGCRYQIAASVAQKYEPGDVAQALLMSHLHYAFPNLPLTIHDQRLVIFFPIYSDDAPGKNIRALQEFHVRHHVKFGLSNVYDHLGRSPEEFAKAVQAADLGNIFYPEQGVFQFKDMTVLELLTNYQRNHKIISLVAPEIFTIYDVDQKKGSDYLPTLSAYLRHGGRSQKICSELHIHKNTLLYRVEKLRTAFGLQLDDGEAQFRYYLSLVILRVLSIQSQVFLDEHRTDRSLPTEEQP